MKVVFAAEAQNFFEMFTAESVQKVFKEMAVKHGVEFVTVLDNGLACEGDDWRAAALKVETRGPGWVVHDQEFLDEVADADVLLVSFAAVNEQLLDAAKKLKLVAVMRSGVENIDVKACQERGVMVCNAPGRLKEPVSDFACAMILDVNRGISYVNKNWKPGLGEELTPPFNPDLFKDLTLGIVGFGFIGQAVAQKLANFNFNMIAYDPFVPQEVADKFGVTMKSLEEVMSESDTITVHARLVDATKNMINADMISLMKPTAFFVNTARAGLEDEEALIKALQEGKIRGAALDVTQTEPVPDDHPLRQLENVILTPHMAGMSGDTMVISAEIIAEQIGMFLSGEEPTAKLKPVE